MKVLILNMSCLPVLGSFEGVFLVGEAVDN